MTSGDLERPLEGVVGGKTAKVLTKSFGMATVNDLLRHYPRRYAQRGELTDLSTLTDGESVTVVAEIESVTVRPMKQRRGSIVEAVVTDGKGHLSVTFFNQAWREREMRAGRSGLFSGQVSSFRNKRQLSHPQFLLFPEGVDDDPEAIAAFAGALIPVYPATGSLTSWQIAGAVRMVLDTLGEVADPIPEQVRVTEGLADLGRALRLIHRPVDFAEVELARARLKFEEAFVLQVVLAQRRQQMAHLT
ncbi:MAG: ATP-dependent DNA helicase RecG, partial [Actinobacteria bacterium]|nr:ATP-dependent DNA helicase RecG [Actinomycetota bacterium]